MINLLEFFGIFLIILLTYVIYKEKNYKILILGITLFPFGFIWESMGVNYGWEYTTPHGVVYSFYITNDIPLIIPIGWSLSFMLLFWFWDKINKKIKINIIFLFMLGTLWGLIFELIFVNLGYWHYLLQPQIVNLRPNVPIGWGLLTFSLIYIFEFLWSKFGKKIRQNPLNLSVFFIVYSIVTPILVMIIKFVSLNIIDPFCLATFCL
jgi:hypothetical protein